MTGCCLEEKNKKYRNSHFNNHFIPPSLIIALPTKIFKAVAIFFRIFTKKPIHASIKRAPEENKIPITAAVLIVN